MEVIFLVSLNKVTNSEKILLCRSLVKEDIDFWNESALVTNPTLNFEKLEQLLENFVATEVTTLTNKSEKLSFFIAGYVAKQLHTKTHCDVCATRFSGCAAEAATGSYFDILNRGGLTICFSVLCGIKLYKKTCTSAMSKPPWPCRRTVYSTLPLSKCFIYM